MGSDRRSRPAPRGGDAPTSFRIGNRVTLMTDIVIASMFLNEPSDGDGHRPWLRQNHDADRKPLSGLPRRFGAAIRRWIPVGGTWA